MQQKILLILLCLLSSCKWGIDLDYSLRLQKGNWRGSIETPIGELPFLFGLEIIDSVLSGSISGQGEDLFFDEVICQGDSLFIVMDKLKMRFKIIGNAADSLKGEMSYDSKEWTKCVAAFGEKYKFISRSRAFSTSLNGDWTILADSKKEILMQLEEGATDLFAYFKDPVFGPIMLSGIKDAKRVLLSGISGDGCVLLLGGLRDSTLVGEGWDGMGFSWEAKRVGFD